MGSGLFSSLCLVILASQQIPSIPSDSVVFILLFVQWQAFVLTAAKLGIDQAIFATVSGDQRIHYNIPRFIITHSLPICLFSSIIVALTFSITAGAVAFLSTILDVYSIAWIAHANARRRFGVTAVANVLKFPLFFVLIFLSSGWYSGRTFLLLCFLLSSMARAVWIYRQREQQSQDQEVFLSAVLPMTVQQLLNFCLYRLDQLALASFGTFTHITAQSTEMFVYIAKFPELIGGGILLLGTLTFPTLVAGSQIPDVHLRLRITRGAKLLLLVASLGICVGFFVYQISWKEGMTISLFQLSVPFLLTASLILPTHVVSYVMLRNGYLRNLIRNLGVGVVSGGIVCTIALKAGHVTLLAWTVPIQLIVFLLTSFTMHLYPSKALYRFTAEPVTRRSDSIQVPLLTATGALVYRGDDRLGFLSTRES